MIDQYGVLAWKPDGSGGKLILLITSRETRRWVVPRGNPMRGRTPQQAAAEEAWEEAGIRGFVGAKAIGRYRYGKRLGPGGPILPTRVTLYPMQVDEEAADWPERQERERRWFAPAEAAGAVEEPELALAIADFAGAAKGAGSS